IALNLLKEYPEIARGEIADTGKILELLSKRPKAFASGSRLGFWKGLLYRSPSIKSIRNTKLAHKQTLEILRIICVGAVDIATAAKETENVLKKPMFTAAKFGIYEIVMEIIISYFPWSLSFSNEDGDDIFHAAVKHRQENVFNIIFNMPKAQTFFVADIDVKGVNILHSAARSVPSSEVSGAALQMQRELQWFKAVENYVHPTLQDQLNDEDKTPRELFTEEHKGLVKEGEKWMKDTAQSCSLVDSFLIGTVGEAQLLKICGGGERLKSGDLTSLFCRCNCSSLILAKLIASLRVLGLNSWISSDISATLVITIAFAAAITVPGDSDSRGMPNYLHEPSFTIFGISNALALFSSVCFEEDFLVSLPKKLIIGLITLFFSIASLMVAFAATVYIVQFHQWKWVIIPMGLLGCLPVYLFATLQFRLLVEVLFSTYGPGIFKPLNYLRM
ncbi:hypothetical protein CICLE_v10027095mg, partial [Citrus x clementina]